jgi:hypothetical protein
MDTKKISKLIYDETMEDMKNAKNVAVIKLYQRPWVLAAIVAVVLIGAWLWLR